MHVESESVYAAASAARHENNISCLHNNLLYSRSRCPVLHDLTGDRKVCSFLVGHTDQVNGLCFVNDPDSTTKLKYIISSSHDKTAIIWQVDFSQRHSLDYKVLFRLKSPVNEVFTARACLRRSDDTFLSITTNLAGQIFLWCNDELVQTLEAKYYAFQAHIFTFMHKSVQLDFLFLAGSDNKIHVFQILPNELTSLFDLSGHSDWIKCIDTSKPAEFDREFLLASASQDAYIRVWHMKIIHGNLEPTQVRTTSSDELLVGAHHSNLRLTATLETVLIGHENIVHGLCWFKKATDSALQLISCSADKNLIIWRSKLASKKSGIQSKEVDQLNAYDQRPASSDVWKEITRLGETGETNLPFLGVCLSEDEKTIFAHSLHGAIHSWNLSSGPTSAWEPGVTITGHFEPVTDLSWEMSNGSYLLSTSLDKTCRLHTVATDNRWHEVGRPQVHGHEINCITSLGINRFASGSEEKTIRAFEATRFFMKSLMNQRIIKPFDTPEKYEEYAGLLESLPLHAQLPALGLSNRASESPYDLEEPVSEKGNAQSTNWYSVSNLVKELAQIDQLETLPTEDILLQSTLWWENGKLYGHANEIYALASNPSGTCMASASKANRPDLAKILFWDCSKFRKLGEIEYHSLTITRLRFSCDSRYLLSVSRDRTWSLSKQTGLVRNPYKLLIGTNKTNAVHERIIWDCTWTWDSKYFITVSRDKKAIVWSVSELDKPDDEGDQGQGQMEDLIRRSMKTVKTFNSSIQAIDSPNYQLPNLSEYPRTYLVAFGFENGCLEMYSFEAASLGWTNIMTMENLHQGLPIRRLTFRPDKRMMLSDDQEQLLLASAGDDCVVRLTNIKLLSGVEQT